jgi:hypothetical protein
MAEAITGIWVRRLSHSNFRDIERHPSAGPRGGGGALYIEVTKRVVPDLLELLGKDPAEPPETRIDITTGVIGAPEVSASLVWRPKSGGRMHLYQNRQGDGFEQRLGRILAWLDAQGRPDLMVGVGETGASDTYGILASTWWSASWAWATRNTNRVGIVSYYNSTNLHNGVRVSLYDSPGLRQAYRSSQGSPVTCRL